jgi:hypothetical protein
MTKTLTFELLNKILGPYAYDMISKMCTEMSDSSEAESAASVSTDIGAMSVDSVDYTDTSGICGSSKVTSAALQLYRFPQDNSYRYEWGYSVTACKEDMSFSVSIRGPSDSDVIASKMMERGNQAADSGEKVLNFEAKEICLVTSDQTVGNNGIACFPLAWGRTNLNQRWNSTATT